MEFNYELQLPSLNVDERRNLAKWLEAKILVKEIANNLDRGPSTVYHEIKRNYYCDGHLRVNRESW